LNWHIVKSLVRIMAVPLSTATLGKLLTHVCLFQPTSSIIWYQPMQDGDALQLEM